MQHQATHTMTQWTEEANKSRTDRHEARENKVKRRQMNKRLTQL